MERQGDSPPVADGARKGRGKEIFLAGDGTRKEREKGIFLAVDGTRGWSREITSID